MQDIVLLLDSSPSGSGKLYFERARDLGFEPVLVSTRPSRHQYYLSEFRSLQAPSMTVAGVLEAIGTLGQQRIAGVCTSLSIRAELAARVAEQIGRPHANADAIAICCNKFRTRQMLVQAGIHDVGFALVKSAAEGRAAAENLGPKVIVKPPGGSGSVGVRICETPTEAAAHVDALFASNADHLVSGVVVETYVTGPQYGVEIFDGKVLAVRRRYISAPPASVLVGADFPTLDPPDVTEALGLHAQRAVHAVGYVRGAAHVEVRKGANGPCLIEINPRVAGATGPINVKYATGIDLIETALRFACGLPYELAPKQQKASAVRTLLREGPSIAAVLGREEALQVPGVVELKIFPEWFSRRGPARDFNDRIANVISVADTAEQAIYGAEQALRLLKVIPEPAWRYYLRRLPHKISALLRKKRR